MAVVTVLALLIMFGICPAICYGIAVDKGKGTGNAVVGGCLFGVFGVLYYLLATNDKDNQRRDVQAQQQISLQQQQLFLMQQSLIAQGVVLPAPPPAPEPAAVAVAPAPEPPAPPEPEPDPWDCPRCGQHNMGRAKACSACLFEPNS